MTRKRIVKIILWTVVLGALVWFIATRLSSNKVTLRENAQLSQITNPSVLVRTGTVQRLQYDGSFQLLGSFAPFQQVPILSETGGKIAELHFVNGSFVQAGQVLAAIDNDLLQFELENARNNLAKAAKDLHRLTALLGDGGVTQQQVDDATLGVDNLKSRIKILEKQISMTYIKAPFSGVVSDKTVENGSLVGPSVQLGIVTNVSQLRLRVYMTEGQVVKVNNAKSVPVKVDKLPNLELRGTITFTDVNATQNGRYLVEVLCPNPGNQIRAGMTATAFFGNDRAAELLAIPRDAIVGSLMDARVYVLNGEIAELRPVLTGQIADQYVEIREGLKEGEIIVVSGQINLEDGKPITVVNRN